MSHRGSSPKIISDVLIDVFNRRLMDSNSSISYYFLFRSLYPIGRGFELFHPVISGYLLFIRDHLNDGKFNSEKIIVEFDENDSCIIKVRRHITMPYKIIRIENFMSNDNASISVNVLGDLCNSNICTPSIPYENQIEFIDDIMHVLSKILESLYVIKKQ